MSATSQFSLPQSKTAIARTPDPADTSTTQTVGAPKEETNETTNANKLKTPTVMDEMGEEKQEHQQDSDDLNQLEEKRDDWIIENKNKICINIETPSFIRLFVIRRIIDKYMKNNTDINNERHAMYDLANVFKDGENTHFSVANILIRLLKYGVKNYMKNCYFEKSHANIIEKMFNKIILEKFGQEYNELITNAYEKNIGSSDSNFYQNVVFNSSDLMCEIFQFLEYGVKFDKDLFECSLVNSYWLYHVWNTHSIYHIDLTQLFKKTLTKNKNNNTKKNDAIRVWQRLIDVKSIHLAAPVKNDDDRYFKPIASILYKLSMMRRIEKVDVNAYGNTSGANYALLFKALLGKCKQRVTYCQTRTSSKSLLKENELSPLKLPNSQFVGIGDTKFYRIWTDKCKWLKLYDTEIRKDLCQFIIENCDCSNITSLELNHVSFDNELIVSIALLKKFVLKFTSLKKVKLWLYGAYTLEDQEHALTFVQLFKTTLSKNKVETELTIYGMDNRVNILLQQQSLTLEKLVFRGVTNSSIADVRRLISDKDGCGLKHVVIGSKLIAPDVKLLNDVYFRSIKVFEVLDFNGYCDYNSLNYVLRSKMIIKKDLFVTMDCEINYNNNRSIDEKNDSFLSLFKQLCGNIYHLISSKIGIDIKIGFVNVHNKKIFNSHLSVYSSYFECKEFFSTYNQPKCDNDFCLPRNKPYTYFYINKKDKSFLVSVTNVNYL